MIFLKKLKKWKNYYKKERGSWMAEESFFNQKDLVKVDKGTIEELKIKARANKSGK